MSVATATEYAAQVAGTASPRRIPSSPPETSCPEPSATSATPSDETAAAIQKRRVSRSRPSTIPKRPEQKPDRRGGADVQCEHERELVEPQDHSRGDLQPEVPSLDPERSLGREPEGDEHEASEPVANRRVGERLETVLEDVLRRCEVQRPE